MIADPVNSDGDPRPDSWQLPALDRIPSAQQIQAGIATLKMHMEPASVELIGLCLARLSLACKLRSTNESEAAARTSVYLDELIGYPPDILVETCREWCRTEKFFPATAELILLLQPKLEARKRQLRRLQAMLEPRLGKPPEWRQEPLPVRLKALRDVRLKVAGETDPRARRYERELAEAEGREPAEWATAAPLPERHDVPPSRPCLPPPHVQTTPAELLAALDRRNGFPAENERPLSADYADAPTP